MTQSAVKSKNGAGTGIDDVYHVVDPGHQLGRCEVEHLVLLHFCEKVCPSRVRIGDGAERGKRLELTPPVWQLCLVEIDLFQIDFPLSSYLQVPIQDKTVRVRSEGACTERRGWHGGGTASFVIVPC